MSDFCGWDQEYTDNEIDHMYCEEWLDDDYRTQQNYIDLYQKQLTEDYQEQFTEDYWKSSTVYIDTEEDTDSNEDTDNDEDNDHNIQVYQELLECCT